MLSSVSERTGINQSNVTAVAVGGVVMSAGLLLYRLGVKWNNYQVNEYEAKVIRDSTKLLGVLQSSKEADYEDNKSSVQKKSPFSPIVMGDQTKVTFKNRIIKAATYEALCDNNGVPLPALADFHAKMADGGCGMTIVAYAAVCMAGRSFPAQLVCRSESLSMLQTVTAAIHEHGSLACVQLTHAGYFSDRSLASTPVSHEQMSAQSIFNPAAFRYCRAMSVKDHDNVLNNFVQAARVAVDAGFDCLEVHCGHGYLLSQFLSPHLNPNTTFEERLRFPLKILSAIKSAVGANVIIMVKMNLVDGNSSGITVEDSCIMACEFASVGVDIIALSGGLILENGLFMLRGQVPLRNMIEACCHDFLKRIALFLFGPLLIPYMPYSEMFFRIPARCVLESVKQWSNRQRQLLGSNQSDVKVCYIGGVQTYSSLETIISDDGFDFVQSGRALLYDPKVVQQWEEEERNKKFVSDCSIDSGCTRCNKCIVDATMKQQPISCVEW